MRRAEGRSPAQWGLRSTGQSSRSNWPVYVIKLLTPPRYRESAACAGFNEKYPYAYDTYKGKKRHEKIARGMRACLNQRAENHRKHIQKIHNKREKEGRMAT
jgi:hypothetical protein